MKRRILVKLSILLVLAAVMVPKFQLYLTRLDMFKATVAISRSSKQCCHVTRFGILDARGCGFSVPEVKKPSVILGAEDVEEDGPNDVFRHSGFEDIVYVEIPSKTINEWGGLGCGGSIRHVFLNSEGPDAIDDGQCVLITHQGDMKVNMQPVPLLRFPHHTLAFHPHGMYRSSVSELQAATERRQLEEAVAEEKEAREKGEAQTPAATRDIEAKRWRASSKQRISVISHGFQRGDERILEFRFIVTAAGPALLYEGSLATKFFQQHRGGLNDLVIGHVTPDTTISEVITTDSSEFPDNINGRQNGETLLERVATPLTLLKTFFDVPNTKLLRCHFFRDVEGDGSISFPHEDTAAVKAERAAETEKAELAAGVVREEKDPRRRLSAEEKLQDKDRWRSQPTDCDVLLDGFGMANGIAQVTIGAPGTHRGAPAPQFRFLFVADLIKHEIVVLVGKLQAQDGLKTPYRQIAKISAPHAIDNLELDLRGGQGIQREFKHVHQHTPGGAAGDRITDTTLFVEDIVLFYGSIAYMREAAGLMFSETAPSVGGTSKMSLSIRYDPEAKEEQQFTVYNIQHSDVLIHAGDRFTGTSVGLVLDPPPQRTDSARPDTPFAVMGSWTAPGLFICPL